MHPSVCILCGTNDHAATLYPATVTLEDFNPTVFSARRSPDRIHGEILRCARCGLVYPREILDPPLLAELYRESTHTYAGMELFLRRTYLRYVKKALARFPKKGEGRKSMDIGCGNGFLLPDMRKLGFDAYGLEPSSDAVARAEPDMRSRIRLGMASPETLPPQSFDLVTCFQTLDHIADPVAFLRVCFASLTPGGVVLFINHNIASWTAKILGELCPMIDIEHTYLHTKGTMRLLFERAGFTDIEVFSVRNDYPLWYWIHLLPLAPSRKTALMKIMRPFRNLVLPLSAGNLGLIARKPPSVV